jgi:hypothetical protein
VFQADDVMVGKTLTHRLDDACEQYGLEWLLLPFDRDSWRRGPYWGALVVAQYKRRRGRHARFYPYLEAAHIPDARRSDPPEVVYISLEPVGRREMKRLLLAQLEPCDEPAAAPTANQPCV